MKKDPYESVLALVRDYSERATLRPSPLRLRCSPLQERVCTPFKVSALRIQDRISVALMLQQMSREYRRNHRS
jgi:hypothetical protein